MTLHSDLDKDKVIQALITGLNACYDKPTNYTAKTLKLNADGTASVTWVYQAPYTGGDPRD